MKSNYLRRIANACAVCWLWLALSLASQAGQLFTPPVSETSGSGNSLDILSDASPATEIAVPPQASSAVAMPAVLLASSSVEASSRPRVVAALSLDRDIERRPPVLVEQFKVAFPQHADAPIYADGPLLADVSPARLGGMIARFEIVSRFALCELAPKGLVAISAAAREECRWILFGLEFLTL
jgi:hypothetical protein